MALSGIWGSVSIDHFPKTEVRVYNTGNSIGGANEDFYRCLLGQFISALNFNGSVH
jgi:hypothetical protein